MTTALILMMLVWIAVTSFFFKGIENAKGDTKKLIFNFIGFILAIAAGGYAYKLIVSYFS